LTSVSVASPGQCSISDNDLSSAVILSESRGDSILHSLSTSSHSMDEVCFPHDLAFGDYISSLKDEHVFGLVIVILVGFPLCPTPMTRPKTLSTLWLHMILIFLVDEKLILIGQRLLIL